LRRLVCADFYFLSPTLKTTPIVVAYAIWSGLDIIRGTLFELFRFR
jgi:multidrug transporter EmrE-like cation transporter